MEILTFENTFERDNFLVLEFTKKSIFEIEKKGFFSVALSGGETPISFYKKLSEEKKILWNKIHIFFVDERMVEDGSKVSNTYHINEALIKPLSLKNVHYIDKDLDSKDASLEYELEIKSFFKNENPSFDFIVLGLGKDGHTASLFPDRLDLLKSKNLVVSSQKEEENFYRITFTYHLINDAKNIFILACGENKASIVKKVIDNDKSYPACHIKAKESCKLLIDKKASQGIVKKIT
ncbi:MAG: 6-phosphogluconolactonase [Chlamydiae bacterium RIFCSPHIGHO2_12_FULL_27_8]|nr:MAG: 6-phosphogluconolactonase [Chlamydiae bacterium RIFCSPHIGHO2_12_FULL_27_8]OGN66665.1 MAG: 6-phosphogluconolactonase [Chlamydiae bacterium RIFCSPLOWO2_01_FULL_28_7]